MLHFSNDFAIGGTSIIIIITPVFPRKHNLRISLHKRSEEQEIRCRINTSSIQTSVLIDNSTEQQMFLEEVFVRRVCFPTKRKLLHCAPYNQLESDGDTTSRRNKSLR